MAIKTSTEWANSCTVLNCPWIDKSFIRKPMSLSPASEVIQVLVELVEKSLRPVIDVSGGVHYRCHHLCAVVIARLEKMQRHSVSRQFAALYGTANSIKNMVAV